MRDFPEVGNRSDLTIFDKILSEPVYLRWVDLKHPHGPSVAEVQQVVIAIGSIFAFTYIDFSSLTRIDVRELLAAVRPCFGNLVLQRGVSRPAFVVGAGAG
jgi:hypothetical protein